MKQPLTIIADGVTFVLVRGYIYINGKVYVPVSTLEEVARQIRVQYHKKQSPVTVEEMTRILSRNIHHRFVPDFLKLAADSGYIQRVAGTSGDSAEYLPVQQGN